MGLRLLAGPEGQKDRRTEGAPSSSRLGKQLPWDRKPLSSTLRLREKSEKTLQKQDGYWECLWSVQAPGAEDIKPNQTKSLSSQKVDRSC